MNLFRHNKNLRNVEDIQRLASLLAASPEVVRFDEGDHKEAWALADSLAEMESQMHEFLDSELPMLVAAELPPSEAFSVLLDIGEVFRRILYHMLEQQRFYRYLMPDSAQPEADDSPLESSKH